MVRKGRKRHDANGKLVRISPHSARNARAVKLCVKHAGEVAKLQHARLDRRTWAGKVYVATAKDLVAHLGGEPSAAQAMLIDHAARLKIVLDIAWGAAMRDGLDKQSPALDNFLRALKNQRDTLGLLGLERKARPLTLESYLIAKEAETA